MAAHAGSWLVRTAAGLGRGAVGALAFAGQCGLLCVGACGYMVRGGISLSDTIYQMARIGLGSLPVVLLTATMSGMVLAWHLGQQAATIGGQDLVGWAVAEIICRELGPALTAVVLAAQAGSAMAAELGTMKVTEQIDALRAMATSPVEHLVVPRLVAATLVMPALVLLADLFGVAGGYVLGAGLGGLSGARYLDSIQANLAPWLVLAGMGKSVFFGIIIATVGCQQGLSAGFSAEEVGKVTTRAVVYCIVLVYAANLLLTALFFPGR